MRPPALIIGLLIAGALTRTVATRDLGLGAWDLGLGAPQAPVQSAGSTTMTIDEVAHRVMQAEAALTVRMKAFRPIVEAYVQHVETREPLGSVPVRDDYFLGGFEWSELEGPKMTRLTPERGGRRKFGEWLTRRFGVQLKFEGFAAMTVPDWRLLDGRQHAFTFLRREVLGEVRCLVFEVAPRVDPSHGFTGRIWVEEREFNIVRFNGITRSPAAGRPLWFSVDSWRANVKPSIWLPSYVYSELQSDAGPIMKSHVRLWGYGLKAYRPGQPVPKAEDVLARLANAGLLAPPGEVDKVLLTVLTNLQITNNLNLQPLTARVLLTSPLESFTIGRTVVLSRGLIDVLPDEASLATMLAHEFAHIVLGHRPPSPSLPPPPRLRRTGQRASGTEPQFASAETLAAADDQLLATIVPRYTVQEEGAAAELMVGLLKNSPYKDKLADAGLFLRAVSAHSKTLTHLIQPHIGGYVSNLMPRFTDLIQQAPALPEQVAALPLGARVAIDPWTGGVELVRTASVPPASAREKASLAVTPLVPYLRYAEVKQAGALPQ